MTPAPARRDVFFLGEGDDARFCLLTSAAQPLGTLLFVPPFAEEMNRSRRMVSLAAQAFAAHGWSVLQMDLHGCGDSEGDFGDASWPSWLRDLDRGHAWLQQQGHTRVALWSLRAGSLLVSDWLAQRDAAQPSLPGLPWLCWQPVFNGAQYLTQFLRIRLGADLATSPQSSQVLGELRNTLKAGEAISVGGYWLNANLAQSLGQSQLRPPPSPGSMALLEVASGAQPELSPVASSWIAKAGATGQPVTACAVPGAKFWQSPEVETAPALITASLPSLQEWAA